MYKYLNFSNIDNKDSWKCKLINKSKKNCRIELKKTFGPTYMFIIVALNGWYYSPKNEVVDEQKNWTQLNTEGLNVRISMNGSLKLAFEQFKEIDCVVSEAMDYLKNEI